MIIGFTRQNLRTQIGYGNIQSFGQASLGNSVPSTVVPSDTHDGVWDADLYAKYQERLRKRREQLARDERNDKQRKTHLRKELVRLYRGLPEEQIEKAKELAPELKDDKSISSNIDHALPVLDSASVNLDRMHRQLIQEYKGILAREALRVEMEEEDELESIITAVL